MPVSIGYSTNTLTTLKALPTTDLVSGYLKFVVDQLSWFQYNSTSSATADDVNIIQPESGTGRWYKQYSNVNSLTSSSISDFSEAVDDRVNTLLQDSSTLTKTYNDPANTLSLSITANSITDTHINTGAAIAQSKIANLTTDLSTINTSLSSKASTSHTHTSSAITDFSESVDDRVATLLTAGSNITLSYNDTSNTLTIGVDTLTSADVSDFSESVDDRVSNLLLAGTNITLTYDDVAGTLTIESTASGGGGGGAIDWDTIDLTAWDGAY